MKNKWLLVSVILAGVVIWLWRKTTSEAPTTPRAPTAALGRPLEQGQPQYMAIRNAVVIRGKPNRFNMIPGIAYVKPMQPTLVPGVFKNVYFYVHPGTGYQTSGITPPIIGGVKWV